MHTKLAHAWAGTISTGLLARIDERVDTSRSEALSSFVAEEIVTACVSALRIRVVSVGMCTVLWSVVASCGREVQIRCFGAEG